MKGDLFVRDVSLLETMIYDPDELDRIINSIVKEDAKFIKPSIISRIGEWKRYFYYKRHKSTPMIHDLVWWAKYIHSTEEEIETIINNLKEEIEAVKFLEEREEWKEYMKEFKRYEENLEKALNEIDIL